MKAWVVFMLLVFLSAGLIAEQVILKPGSLYCKSYQDLILAREMLGNDPQFASNALQRSGVCKLSNAYQELQVILLEEKNVGYRIRSPHDINSFWVFRENLILQKEPERLIIYPASGQSANELLTDKAECQQWASEQTGFNMDYSNNGSSSAQFVPPPIYSYSDGREVARGAGVGAAHGAVGGAITGNAGAGATIGAAAGALFGGVSRAQRHEEEREWHRQHAAMKSYHLNEQNRNAARGKNNFNVALASCMEGRGYKVQ